MVTDPKNHSLVKDIYMTPASSIKEALKITQAVAGRDTTINVIRDGIGYRATIKFKSKKFSTYP